MVRVEFPPDPVTGKRRQRAETVKTKKAAEARLAEWLTEIERGIEIDGGKMTFGEYLAYWLDTYAKHNVRPTTYESYAAYARRHIIPALGSIPLTKLRPAQVQAFYMHTLHGKRADNRGGSMSARTVRYCHSIVREALHHAMKWGMVVRNVADATEPPRAVRPQIQVWSAEQAARFLAAAEDDVYSPLWLIALTTGMRQGELMGLRWQDVDLANGVIHVRHTLVTVDKKRTLHEPKTKSGRRTITLPASAIVALREHRTRQIEYRLLLGSRWQDHDAVFASATGGWLDASNITRNFRIIMENEEQQRQAERPNDKPLPRIRFHDLRHTHATLLLQQGENVKVVSERLGHASIAITLDTYAHVLPSMQQQAAVRIDAALFGT
jgi:integrase